MFTRDWIAEPIPSRGTPKDRRRQMEGDQLKRDAEERAGRRLGDERQERERDDRNRGGDLGAGRYDRGGDRGGDRYRDRDRGGDRYDDRYRDRDRRGSDRDRDRNRRDRT